MRKLMLILVTCWFSNLALADTVYVCKGVFNEKLNTVELTFSDSPALGLKASGDWIEGQTKTLTQDDSGLTEAQKALGTSHFEGGFFQSYKGVLRDYTVKLTVDTWPVGRDGLLVAMGVCSMDCGIYGGQRDVENTNQIIRPDLVCTKK